MAKNQEAPGVDIAPKDEDLEILEMRACLELLGIHRESEGDRYQVLLDPEGIVLQPQSPAGIKGAEVLYEALLERLRAYERGNFYVTDLLSGVRYIFALLRRSGFLSSDPVRVEVLLQNVQAFAASGGPDREARQKHASVALSAAVLLFNAIGDAPAAPRWNLLRIETLAEILRCATAADKADRVIAFMLDHGSDMIERYYSSRSSEDRAVLENNDAENGIREDGDFATARCGYYRALFYALKAAEEHVRFRTDIIVDTDLETLLIQTGCRALEVAETSKLVQDSDREVAVEIVCRALAAPSFTKFAELLRLETIQADTHMRYACEALTLLDESLYESLLAGHGNESEVTEAVHKHRQMIETKLRVLRVSRACARGEYAAEKPERSSEEPACDSKSHRGARILPYAALAKHVGMTESDMNLDEEVEKWIILAIQFGVLRAKIDQAKKMIRIDYAFDPDSSTSRESWQLVAGRLERLRLQIAQIADTTESILLAP